jgi:hypothetical protein
MPDIAKKIPNKSVKFALLLLSACFLSLCGCQEVDTVKRELLLKIKTILSSKKQTFTPRDGITLRATNVYQTANNNSAVIANPPAETHVNVLDKAGEYFRVRIPDGKEGYVDAKVVGGEDILQKTADLKRSIEGMPPQGEGVTKTKAYFRLEPGRNHQIIEILPPGKKFEIYERVVTIRSNPQKERIAYRGKGGPVAVEEPAAQDESADDLKKDVWYKVKLEDGRVGYLYTHNISLNPPEDIARELRNWRIMGWRPVNSTDDPDLGTKSNFIVACAPVGKDPGCDYTKLYFMSWSTRLKKRQNAWDSKTKISGVLPITSYHSEGKPGFSVRSLHPTKKDKLVLINFVLAKGTIKKVSEEEIPNTADLH